MNNSFKEGFEKVAGTISEGVGAAGWFPIPSAIGGLLGHSKGGYKTEKAMKSREGKSFSNALIPGVGAYRLARRLSTKNKIRKKVEKGD